MVYAYRDRVPLDWNEWRDYGREQLKAVQTREQFGLLLEELLEHLLDFHVQVRMRLPGGQLPAPSVTSLRARLIGDVAVIQATGPSGYAVRLGMRPGDHIVAINQSTVKEAIEDRLPFLWRTNPDERAKQWALDALLTGRRGEQITLLVRNQDGERTVVIDPTQEIKLLNETHATLVQTEQRGPVGIIRIHNSLGENDLIAAFDEALDELIASEAIVLDLRNTPSGGNSDVARAIIGRFIANPQPYQAHELVAVERLTGIKRFWQEWVYPRDERYNGKLVILVNGWTGSMGEGLTIGLHWHGRATVIGSAMAQLLGAVYTERLPDSGIEFNIPGEKLFHINGSPREAFRPDLVVEFTEGEADSAVEDTVLEAAMQLLSRQ
ncbi:MAG: S41 family peptidase [Verrucomicrobia bacterium]|nr:S41 family peptidase [Verrucomicrobiota bacterium]